MNFIVSVTNVFDRKGSLALSPTVLTEGSTAKSLAAFYCTSTLGKGASTILCIPQLEGPLLAGAIWFFVRGVLPVVAVLHWNYLRYSRGRGYYRRLGSPR